MTVDDSDPVIDSYNSLENQIKLDICAESFAIDNHNKGRKKSKCRTKANIDNSTQNIEHQFIEVTPEEILSQNGSRLSSTLGPNVTTRSRSKSKHNSGSESRRGSRRGLRRGSKRKNN